MPFPAFKRIPKMLALRSRHGPKFVLLVYEHADLLADRARFLLGDGELQEGQIWEAAMYAPHNKVDNLISTIDVNGQQIDGPAIVRPLRTVHYARHFLELPAHFEHHRAGSAADRAVLNIFFL